MFHLVFFTPEIPGNTGNVIRLAAATGAHLHLVEPLGFDLDDSKLRRAGLDYHDLATTTVHPSLPAAWRAIEPTRIFAYIIDGKTRHTDIHYQPGDALLFGPESVGLPDDIRADAAITDTVRIPMLEARRSLNLANCAAIAIYEAWRQQGFLGASTQQRAPR